MRLTRKLCALTAGISLLAACSSVDKIETASVPSAGSVVRINTMAANGQQGHGSGVYIGNDIIITAAHVVKGRSNVVLRLDNGASQGAEVLWINEEYDVAAVRPAAPSAMTAAPLDCRSPERGETIIAAGSPGGEDDLFIPGVVVGNLRKTGHWSQTIVVAMPATGGISGGPTFDAQGEVVGIVVGGMLGLAYQEGARMDLSQTGLSYVVPASAICLLLGREGV